MPLAKEEIETSISYLIRTGIQDSVYVIRMSLNMPHEIHQRIISVYDQLVDQDRLVEGLNHQIFYPQFNPKEGCYAAAFPLRLVKKTKISPPDMIELFMDPLKQVSKDLFDVTTNGKMILFTPLLDSYGPEMYRVGAGDVKPEKILVDFSSPNIAKDMHVGHLRSTIIGDCLARLFEYQGHDVSRINHIGDFGTQFGMLLEYMARTDDVDLSLESLQTYYQAAKLMFKEDPEFKTASLAQVARLQAGDEEALAVWREICTISESGYRGIYERLGIELEDVGESFYREMIPEMLAEFDDHLETDDKGRLIAMIPGFKIPLILLKSDGAFTYDTTDLAALYYRLTTLKMDRIYYVVDMGQTTHFKLLFAFAKKVGFLTDQQVYHVPFGLVLGEDGTRIKTSRGDTPKLTDLLDEGVVKARKAIAAHGGTNRTDPESEDFETLIRSVAYGAIKYADLQNRRVCDYKFSFNRMLQFEGDTAVYLMYAYARIFNILRNSGLPLPIEAEIKPKQPDEIKLLKLILRFPEIVEKTANTMETHRLCNYLYDLARQFHSFFTRCRCLYYDNGTLVDCDMSRLSICQKTIELMGTLFDLIGVDRINQI